jgi:lycopene cyclase domain-containing protein
MNIEYLLLNLIIISGPLALSFDKRVRFYRYWFALFPSIFIVILLFIIWDSLVTDRHWFFNTAFTLPIRLLNLPIGEWLFFITVPYACIFTWEVLAAYFSNSKFSFSKYHQIGLSVIIILSGIALLLTKKEYTAIVLIVLGFVFLMDILLKTNIFQQSRTYYFSSLLIIMMIVFNGYLTARPVVLYNKQYQLDFRILTIPIEDFFYGFALIFSVIILYEKFKGIKHG